MAEASPAEAMPKKAKHKGATMNEQKQREAMKDKIKCFFGLHKWKQQIKTTRGGFGYGLCCDRCGLWHKTESIRAPWPEKEQP